MSRFVELGLAGGLAASPVPILVCTMIKLSTSLIIVGIYFDADSGRRHFDERVIGLSEDS
jgi:hypothetical protein